MGKVYRAGDKSSCIISEYASNDWTYNFCDPTGWERPILRVTRTDHTVQMLVVEHKGPLHCDVYANGLLIMDAVGGTERRHVGEASSFSISIKPPEPPAVLRKDAQSPISSPQIQRHETVLTPMPAEISVMRPAPKAIRPPKQWENLKVGMILDFGEKCGVFEHTSYFLDKLNCHPKIYDLKEDNLHRLAGDIIRDGVDVLHIEHEYGLFNSKTLITLIRDVQNSGTKVILDMHTVTPSMDTTEMLNLADKVVFHNPTSKSYYDNSKTEIIPLATPTPEDVGKLSAREKFSVRGSPVIASFGFINPSKGFMETLNAIKDLKGEYPDVRYLIIGSIHPRNDQRAFLSELHTQSAWWGIAENILFFNEFYPIETIINILQAADVTCLFYKKTVYSTAGSSGPARICLAAHRPLIVSDTPTFSEFGGAVLRTEAGDTLKLTEAIRQLLRDEGKQKALVQEGDKFLEEINGTSIARRFETIYRKLGC